jgi:hypothetical protein
MCLSLGRALAYRRYGGVMPLGMVLSYCRYGVVISLGMMLTYRRYGASTQRSVETVLRELLLEGYEKKEIPPLGFFEGEGFY